MIKLFNDISPRNIDKILKIINADNFTYQKDVNILPKNKKENIIFYIEEGSLNIIRHDYNGNDEIIDIFHKGDIIGTMFDQINGDEYEIITKEKSIIIVIEYDNVIKNNNLNYTFYHQFILNLLEILSEKIKAKNKRINLLTKKTIRNKLLEYFKLNVNNINKTVTLSITFTELAEYLSIDRSAMSRELKYLKEEGFIEIKGKKIKLKY